MNGSIKVFGFRSGKSYKMIPALLYYASMAFFIASAIYGELRYYEFETMDYVLMVYKYIFLRFYFSVRLFFYLILNTEKNFRFLRNILPAHRQQD